MEGHVHRLLDCRQHGETALYCLQGSRSPVGIVPPFELRHVRPLLQLLSRYPRAKKGTIRLASLPPVSNVDLGRDEFGRYLAAYGGTLEGFCRVMGLWHILDVSARGNMCGLYAPVGVLLCEHSLCPMPGLVPEIAAFLQMTDLSTDQRRSDVYFKCDHWVALFLSLRSPVALCCHMMK